MKKSELIDLLNLASQRLRHHHDALWKEETHYTWLVYILVAGIIFIYTSNFTCWSYKTIIIFVLGTIMIGICIIAYHVIRKEGESYHEALQICNRLYNALNLDQPMQIRPKLKINLLPNKNTEIKDWDMVKTDANKPIFSLLGKIIKPSLLGIRDWFQITLLLPIPFSITMMVLSIIKVVN